MLARPGNLVADLKLGHMVRGEVLLRELRTTAKPGRRFPGCGSEHYLRIEKRYWDAPAEVQFYLPDLYSDRLVRMPRRIYSQVWINCWLDLIADAEAAEQAAARPREAPELELVG